MHIQMGPRSYIRSADPVKVAALPSIRELRKIGISAILDSDKHKTGKCMKHPFKDWHEERRHKLTASTFAGAVGFRAPRRVRLWLEKIGAIDPFIGNLAISWNNIKEEEALKQYKKITQNDVMRTKLQTYRDSNSEEDWLAASPDGVVDEVFYGLHSRGVLEIKCPYFDGDKTRHSPWKRIPKYCIPQAQGLMEILDRDWMDFYVWTLNGSSLFRIHRDPEYWDVLNIALSDFWFKKVKPAREVYSRHPGHDPLTDPQFSAFIPELRHKLFADILRKSKRIVDRSPLSWLEIGGEPQL